MGAAAVSLNRDDSFKNFLIASVLLHSSFFIFVTVKNFILPSDIIEVPQSIRVDMVALPDKMTDPTPPAPTPTVEVKKQPPPEPAKPIEKKTNTQSLKDTQKKALEKLKAMQALDKIKNEVAQKNETKTPTPAPQYKGNIISSGNSFTGLSKLRVSDYLLSLTSKVRDHWVLPQWLNNQNMKAAVLITLDDRGYVVKKEIYQSSGNSIFDSSCLAAVTDASPFVDPPEEVKGAQILVRFPFQ